MAKYLVMSSGYGMRKHPITGQTEFHKGIDLRRASDSDPLPVLYLKKPYPIRYSYDDINGHKATVYIGKQCLIIICHLTMSLANGVSQKIGVMGKSGRSTGPHFHISFYDRKSNSYVNPLPYLNAFLFIKE